MGIEKLPLRIPEKWNAQWFSEFIVKVLAKLDTRNAVGEGIVISADGNSVATLSATAAIAAAVAEHDALDTAHVPAFGVHDGLVDAHDIAFDAHRAETDPHPDLIDDLTAATSVAFANEIIVSQSGTNRRATFTHVATALAHAPTYYTPASVAKTAGGTATGDVTGVQTMLDGSLYEVAEDTGTPGFDLEFTFSGITKTPTEIVLRLLYEGTATHGVAVEIWNYSGTPAYVRVHQFTAMLDHQILYIPLPVWTNYVSGGAAKVRIVHFSAGNASHDIHIDYVALRSGDSYL